MRVRRCAVLFIEPREQVSFDLGDLLGGGAGLRRKRLWLAIAPHLPDEVPIQMDDLELLGSVSPGQWIELHALSEDLQGSAARLLESGLLIGSDDCWNHHRSRDETIRNMHWWPAAAMLHSQGRWHGINGVQDMEAAGMDTAAGLCARFGAPPSHVGERCEPARRMALPRIEAGGFDDLLARRATCRNFDRVRPLSRVVFARILQRVFSAQAQVRVGGEAAAFLKKTSPSGGGLHATEAYLIVQNVEGVEPGLYHYHPVDHALEPLPPPELPLDEFAKLALAGQHWFANAPALVVLTPRFARSFWKYRHHAKAYRALILDSGHLSQTLYLSATELGLGAFVTSAINEIDIEQAFGLDPLQEGPLAICGFGWRAERMETTEFDPAGEVWEMAADES